MTDNLKMNLLVIATLGVIGCQGQGASTEVVRVEANDLNIASLEIQRSSNADESVLKLRGLGAEGEEIAVATLRTGTVSYTPEPDLMPAELSLGTELKIAVDDESYRLVTPDLTAQHLTEPAKASIARFTRIGAVAAELATEAGIHFLPTQGTGAGEVANIVYTKACSGTNFPTGKGNSDSCCQQGPGTSAELWHAVGGITLAHRQIRATACRAADGSSTCSGAACAFGPCKARILETYNSTVARVFHPTTGDDVCGWATADMYSPEPFSGQDYWVGVTAACTCTGCTNGVATPAGCVD